MEERKRAGNAEALLQEIKRYRALLDAIRRPKRPPKRQGGERSTK
jgi:hypothetical protein